jgi:hypothetical protein
MSQGQWKYGASERMQPYYRLYSVRSEFPRLVRLRPAGFVSQEAHLHRVPRMYCTNLHSNRVITSHRGHLCACQDKKVGMEEAGADNNALRGHMIPVPVFGFCHCSPERCFCLVVVNHLNNARRSLSPSTSPVYKYPPRRPNHTLHPFQGSSISLFLCIRFLLQASVSLGQS